jgi:hypothetical protein
MLKTCLICQYNLKEELKSCPQCGVRFDENILQEVNSIYLEKFQLGELID